MKSIYKRYACIGGGGLTCPCCAPQSGTKYADRARTVYQRIGKRNEARVISKLVQAELDAMMLPDQDVIGTAPNGQLLYAWTEGQTHYIESWHTVPGGGMVLHRAV